MFIQTSRSEGMPLGIIEAISYGLPVLITEGTRLGNTVLETDCGWVAKTDTLSVANTLEQVINEQDTYRSKSKKGIVSAKERFDWSNIAKSTVDSYSKLTH